MESKKFLHYIYIYILPSTDARMLKKKEERWGFNFQLFNDQNGTKPTRNRWLLLILNIDCIFHFYIKKWTRVQRTLSTRLQHGPDRPPGGLLTTFSPTKERSMQEDAKIPFPCLMNLFICVHV